MTPPQWPVACLVVIGLGLVPSIARSDSTAAKKAQTYLNLAGELFDAQDYQGALAELRRAAPLADRDPALPIIRYNIARCLQKLERWADAVAAYESYLQLRDTDRRQAKARRAIQALEPRAFGGLEVDCMPAGAQINVVGVPEHAKSCPWRDRRLRPRRYAIHVSLDGYVSETRSINVVAGHNQTLTVSLPPKRPSSPPPTAEPMAAIQITSAAATEPLTSSRGTLGWVSLAAGAACFGVGGIFHALAADVRDEIETSDAAQAERKRSDFETRRTSAYVGYGLGVAGLVAGTALLATAWGADRDAPAAVAVVPGGIAVRW